MSRVRVFFGKDDKAFQVFTFEQNPNDASIYVSAPEFANMNWLAPAEVENQQPVLLSYKTTAPGKLSLHGSGVAHVKPYESPAPSQLSIRGNTLRAKDSGILNTRHLITLLLSEPKHLPASPAKARKTDYVMTTKDWHPYVLVLWAVPIVAGSLDIQSSFQVGDLEEVPPNSGWGFFNLALHSVVWFAYRTKFMERWPKEAQACFSDGYTVPLLIGTGPGACRLEYRQPEYTRTERGIKVVL
jgi:hypothetical protein